MKNFLNHLCSLVAAIILLQTLFFKFTGAPESVEIFTQLHVEPWGRWLSGVMELLAAALILYPLTRVLGAIFCVAIMAGAVMSHLLVLGIEVSGDGGLLFALALTVLLTSSIVVFLNVKDLGRLFKIVS